MNKYLMCIYIYMIYLFMYIIVYIGMDYLWHIPIHCLLMLSSQYANVYTYTYTYTYNLRDLENES